MKKIFLIAFLCAWYGYASGDGNSGIEVPLRFDRYYNYEEVTEALRALNKAFPSISRLDVVGTSEEGRQIWALTINNPETGEELNKPGVYVDGNIHGNEIQAGEVCLYFANMLLTKYGKNEKITKVVDRNVHYIIPVVNVDGRARFFSDAHTPSTGRSLRVPRDDDRDGLLDEDAPDDLDGDGNICQMRIRDSLGILKTDPEDKRLMIQVKPGEKGEWTLLGEEGIDNDGDGRYNEDSEGYLDANRNWGYDWQPPYIQGGAGNFPLSGKGIRAIAEYIHKRPNIIVNFAFHNYGGMWLRAPSSKEAKIDPRDVAAYDIIGKNAIRITPGYVYQPSFDLYSTYGDTDSHMFNIEGSYSFVGELFIRNQETFRDSSEKPKAGSGNTEQSREQLGFNDHLAMNELFREWNKFTHPVYGEIEIGGWVKMSSRLPHPFMLQELAHRNAMVVLFASEQTPEIKMEVFEVKKAGKNLTQIRVRLRNEKGLPSMSAQSVNSKLYPQDMLKLTGAKVVASGKITDLRNNRVDYQENKPEIVYTSVPGYGYVEFQFLVEGKGEIKLEYLSRKAKNQESTFAL